MCKKLNNMKRRKMKILMSFVFVIVDYVSDANALNKYRPAEHAQYSRHIECDHNKESNLDVSLVKVYFYDFSHDVSRAFPIFEAAKGILQIPILEVIRRFIIFVPGYKSSINKQTGQLIRNTFRNFPYYSYLIIIDHSPYTNDKRGYSKGYEKSVPYVYYIGQALGEMLAELGNGGIFANRIHCIGHNLGAQMLGYTGQAYAHLTGTKLWRITALDPAGPCFSNSIKEDQVRSGVAEYVEVYHCDLGLGSSNILADIDFFLNNKRTTQLDIFHSSIAARNTQKTCVMLWTATVRHPDLFIAWKCDTYEAFVKNECSPDNVTLAGFWNPGIANGVYYFSTDGKVKYK